MIGVMAARCLSIHAGYQCRRSGACCSGVFAIPAEPQVIELVTKHAIAPVDAAAEPFVERNGTTYVGSRREEDACAFYEGEPVRLCRIQARAGVEALPAACRHFPRLFLRDARGLSVTLSHFCPTAAWMLLEDGPLDVVDAGPPLQLDGDVEAYEANGALPPLLHPSLLMDDEGYDAWERAALAVLGDRNLTAAAALDIIAAATETVRTWSPGRTPLASAVQDAFAAVRRPALRPTAARDVFGRPDIDDASRRYLAARLFANRYAYEGRGLRTVIAWLRRCLRRLEQEVTRREADDGSLGAAEFIAAVRATDLALVHRTDLRALAQELSAVEDRR